MRANLRAIAMRLWDDIVCIQPLKPFRDHRAACRDRARPKYIMGEAQIRLRATSLLHGFGPLLHPFMEALILTHLRVELQRKEIWSPPEGLMIISMARCQQIDAFRQGERVAMPMQHWHADKMA